MKKLLALSLLCLSTLFALSQVMIQYDAQSGPAQFAVGEISRTLEKQGKHVFTFAEGQKYSRRNLTRIILTTVSNEKILADKDFPRTKMTKEIAGEGFHIISHVRPGRKTIWVIGGEEAGTMYGGLELEEMIRLYGLEGAREVTQTPYMAMRGTKFNIPLDARSPSYSDASDAAQKNIAEMWSMDFWVEYIDQLARYRYNYISLWSLHPFPSMVKVPEYPEVALDDVKRSTVKWDEHYHLHGTGYDQPEIMNNLETLKRMTIEEKMDFWRKVMAYGKSRNVDFYVVTWNIFTNGINGKYGITNAIDNPITRDYFRKSVRQMFLTYPDLKGIGLTTGENMHGAGFQEKEDWAFDAYAKGVLDVVKEQPDRNITFIHRQHQTGALDIARKFRPLIEHPNIEFIFSFKYAKAHVYSSIQQVYHQDFVKEIQSEGNLKTIWTLRNDDIYHFRWGAPDFVREFIRNIPYEVSRGYYYGSDQYVWGREFLNKMPGAEGELEIKKHGYHWMIWGRLGYDPGMSNQRFTDILREKYPQTDAPKLFEAWQSASMIYPLVTGFHWGSLDFQWYIEGGKSRSGPAQTPSGFHDINRFISLPPHEGTGFASIADFVAHKTSGKRLDGLSPLVVADSIHQYCDRAWELLQSLSHHQNRELWQILEDIHTMRFLGKYYANKIEAATYLALFRATFEQSYHEEVSKKLNAAAHYWRLYASTALSQNHNPLWTNRVGYVDWRKTFEDVLYDLTITGSEPSMFHFWPTGKGPFLEAEDGVTMAKTDNSVEGFSGTGYVDFQASNGKKTLEWTYAAEASGVYMLEIQYARRRDTEAGTNLLVNGEPVGLSLWNVGQPEIWVWDRAFAKLKKGENIISIRPEDAPLIDHLNVVLIYPVRE